MIRSYDCSGSDISVFPQSKWAVFTKWYNTAVFKCGLNGLCFFKFKCEEISEKQKKKIAKILDKKIGDISDLETPKISYKEAKARFKKCNRKEMKQWLRTNGIKHDSKASKKELLKTVLREFE